MVGFGKAKTMTASAFSDSSPSSVVSLPEILVRNQGEEADADAILGPNLFILTAVKEYIG